jgi:hypothetical protein
MALALGGLSLPAQAEDAIRLFQPVPAGKIVLVPPARRTAYSPPRALVVHAVPLIRGSLKDGEPADRSTTPPAKAPWQVAPQIMPEATRTTVAPPPADEWERVAPTPSPRVIRNAAR